MEKILGSNSGFGSKYNSKYLVVVNGVYVLKSNDLKAPCLRRCLKIARDTNTYVELCHQSSSGKVSVLDTWN